MLQVGIPRVLSYYYYYPFYKAFLEHLGCRVVLSAPTSARTLERLSVCPTDEPCVSVKLAFPHTLELIERGVDFLFIPTLVSKDSHSYYCPKHIGLPAMLRSGLDLPPGKIISPSINWREAARSTLHSFLEAGRRLGRSASEARRAFAAALRFQKGCFRLAVERQLTVLELYEQAAGVKRCGRRELRREARHSESGLRIGVVGHGYILYDYMAHHVVERLREHATVLVPEMVPPEAIRESLHRTAYGKALWSFEQAIVGSALYWLEHRLVDSLILVAPFECGPEAVIEVYLEEAAESCGIPFLVLTVDEQTGEAGLVTRLEAFLDTLRDSQRLQGALQPRLLPEKGERRGALVAPLPEKRVLGFPNMGNLGAVLATVFNGELVNAVAPLPVTRRTAELGEELAPEFICYPFAVTLGQMRQCLEAGANTLIMVGGKGRCRLGWYAELQEILLKRAGYSFEMVVIDSPFPLRENYNRFLQAFQRFYEPRQGRKVIAAALLAFYKALLTERAETLFYRLQAWESRRGSAYALFSLFLQRLREAATFGSARSAFREYLRSCAGLSLEKEARPLKVRLIGEIYAVFEEYVNRELARTLGSLPDIRIEVQREVTVMNWLRYNIIKSPAQLLRHRQISAAAQPYLEEAVGGHGQESVGLAVLAPREGMDGVIHLWPFTCMPEIVAQSILTRVTRDLSLPLLTLIVNEQTGHAGMMTRIESFAHILLERRASKGERKKSTSWVST
jgi:predicted nucleotide-binding protein (sugar kinase/HSP70/actin superfamily)